MEADLAKQFFIDITLILVLASALSLVLKYLKLPPVLAYIFTGLLLGPLNFLPIHVEASTLEPLANIGIIFLLFILGLELRTDDLKSVGKVAVITGLGQILFTSVAGFILSTALGFSVLSSVYIAIALTFSSTIVIVKLLSDKKDLNTLYGKISVGFLLVQDFFAIFALIILSGLNTAGDENGLVLNLILTIIKSLILIISVIYLSKNIVPKIVHNIAHSQEVLFVVSIAWAFLVAAIAQSEFVGLKAEIGAFLAGFALANSVESLQIVSKVRSLRDFFILIFFVFLGVGLDFTNIQNTIPIAFIFSIFVLIGNPIIVMFIMKYLGYKKRTGFMSGLAVAQISEFSLIVIALGASIGHFGDDTSITPTITLVGIITFTVSSYMIINSEMLYKKLEPLLGFFELENSKEKNLKSKKSYSNHIVVVGVHRMGRQILESLDDEVKKEILAVDYDPDSVDWLKKNEFNFLFGDIADIDIMEEARVENAKLIISTVPSYEDNVILLQTAKMINPKVEIVVTAGHDSYAKGLYDHGADFVIQPFTFIGKSIGDIIKRDPDNTLEKLRRKRSY